MKINFANILNAVKIIAASACLFIVPAQLHADENITKLGEHLSVYHGPINVGVIRDGDKAMLIDCGDGSVAESLGKMGIKSIDRIVFTHHHRDQACGAYDFAAAGAKIGVPLKERSCFENVEAYWNNPKNRWHLYNFHPHHLMLTEPVRVDETYSDGQTFNWGPAKITVIDTPGHTDGSVSYLVEVDNRRVIFSGDAIYDAGQVWDLHSLQKGFKQLGDYHGFLGARDDLLGSLGRIKSIKSEVLIPSHGQIITDPPAAIDLLINRMDKCYDNYVAISAARHYFTDMFKEYADRPGQMEIRPVKTPPPCLIYHGTTWIVVSKDKAAFIIDCGGVGRIKEIQELIKKGEISKVEGLWVTHYHDDHVNAIPEFQKTFGCPCFADKHVAQVITNPLAWRLACISPSVARVDNVTSDGQSWQWHEFRMTAYHLPGQTLYHGGLLVEKDGLKMFFVGDSFTPAGVDDYCVYNRNWLGRGVGFDRCLELIEQIKPTHIFNCHVADAFDFTPEQCRKMRTNLAEREKLLGQLVPWDHANFGTDEPWIRCFPYEQNVIPGENVKLDVVFTNHSSKANTAACRAVLPRAWQSEPTQWLEKSIPPKSEDRLSISLKIPATVVPGRYAIPIDIRYADRQLPQFTEAIIVVRAHPTLEKNKTPTR